MTASSVGSVERIVRTTCEEFGVLRIELKSHQRQKHIVTARQVAMALVRKLAGLSSTQTARRFDRRHTTALNASKRMDAYVVAAAQALPATATVEDWVKAVAWAMELPSEEAPRPQSSG